MKEHHQKLSVLYGYTVLPLQAEIIQVSQVLRHDPLCTSYAIDLLQTYIPAYPAAVAMQDLPGDIYVKAGEKE